MDPDVALLAQMLAVVGSFAGFICLLIIAVRVTVTRTGRPQQLLPAERPPVDEGRFARLEHAVDAIAVEVERISEGQRFTAKLLGERAPDAFAALTARNDRVAEQVSSQRDLHRGSQHGSQHG